MYNDLRLNEIEPETVSQNEPKGFVFPNLPVYTNSLSNYMKEIDETLKECTQRKVKLINEGYCGNNDECLLELQNKEKTCKNRVLQNKAETLMKQVETLKERIKILENEKNKDNVAEGELQAMRKELDKTNEELMTSDDIGKFPNFPLGAAIAVLIISFIACVWFSMEIPYSLEHYGNIRKTILIVLAGVSVAGFVVSIVQIESITSK